MQTAMPDSFADEIGGIITEYATLEGPLLPMLHAIQEACGCVPAEAHAPICEALNISRAELHGVISFYHDFRDAPTGRHVLKICRAEACQSVGGVALGEAVLEKLGTGWGGTTASGAVTVEPVYCLGLCACGPAAMLDGKVIGRADAGKIDALLAEAGA